MIGHYFDNGEYKFVSRLESAKINHKQGYDFVTWDIGVEFKDLEKEVKDFYKNLGYKYAIDKNKKTRYSFHKEIKL